MTKDFEISEVSRLACLWLGVVIGVSIPVYLIYVIVARIVEVL